jgi:hypothetical protein
MSRLKDYTSYCKKLYTERQYEKAQQVWQESFKRLVEPPDDLLLVGNNIGSNYFQQKEYTKAREILTITLLYMEQQGHYDVLTCKANLAWTYAMLEDLDQADTLAQEILKSLKGPQTNKDTTIKEKAKKIQRYVVQMQERLSQKHPVAGRAETSGVTQFMHFSRFPQEIRDLVWEFAAIHAVSCPKHVTLFLKDHKIRSADAQVQNPLIACKESYTIYSQYYARHNHNTVLFGDHKNRLAVNFELDIFYITGQIAIIDDRLDDRLQTSFLPFQRIALQESFPHVHAFLRYLPHLQELWVLYKHQKKLGLLSADECQQVWSAHHCDEFPDDYAKLDFDFKSDKTPCPVCDWRAGFDIDESDEALRACLDHSFVLTYSSSLPALPFTNDIVRSDKPMFRWVRHSKSGLIDPSKQFSDRERREYFRLVALEYFQRDEVHEGRWVIQGLIDKTYSNKFEDPKLDPALTIVPWLLDFYKLSETTRDYVELVYTKTMGSERPQKYQKMDSHGGIREALRLLGVKTFSFGDDIDDLLASFVFEQCKQKYTISFQFDKEELVYKASCSVWGFDELKAIAGRWMAGKDEDKLLRRGKALFKIEF